MRRRLNCFHSCLLSAVITILIIFSVYLIRGIYPFGNRMISYYDMAQHTVPLYYHTYDVLHGTKSAFWDWYTGLGVSMVDTAGNFLFSPFNLFFFFIKRSALLESMSFFLVLKVSCAAAFMTLFTKKQYSFHSDLWHVAFGLLYGQCGFVVQYYTVIQYIDLVALFPLIMLGLETLLQKKKSIWFSLALALGLVLNIYLMFMVSMFLLFYSALRLSDMDKVERKESIARIGLSTMAAGMLSAVVAYPTIIALFMSSRVSVAENANSTKLFTSILDYFRGNKQFMLFGSEMLISIILYGIITNLVQVRKIWKWIALFFIMAIPIWNEFVNCAWHVGGYVEFPMRFGYILTFCGICLTANYLKENENHIIENEKVQKLIYYLRLFTIAFGPFVIVAMFYFFNEFHTYGIRELAAYAVYKSIFLILGLLYFLTFLTAKNAMRPVLCLSIVIIQVTMGWIGFLAPDNKMSVECEDDIVINSEFLYSYMEHDEEDCINRIKDISNSLNTNYPLILKKAAISNWTWGSKNSARKLLTDLGYSENYTRFLDNGGTIYSDALLNVRKVISFCEADGLIYKNEQKVGQYYINEMNTNYPFGIIVDEDLSDFYFDENATVLENTNVLFQATSHSEQNLFEVLKLNPEDIVNLDIKDELYYHTYEVDSEYSGWFYLDLLNKNTYFTIYVNGEIVEFPDLGAQGNILYPVGFVNGLLSLGYYDDGIELTVCSMEPIDSTIQLGIMDSRILFEDMARQNNTTRTYSVGKDYLDLKLMAKEGEFLMLPIGYDSAYQVQVNNEKVIQKPAINEALMMIPLKPGENVVKIQFTPRGIVAGTVITFMGIVFLAALWKWDNYICGNRIIKEIAFCMFLLCTTGFFAYAYLYQIAYSIFIRAKYLW